MWVVALGMFQSGLELVNPPQRWRKIVWRQFWGAHQRFFKYMCIAAKVSATVERAQAAVRGGRSVVIGLQATGEALAQAQLVLPGRQGFVCSARCVFQNLVEKQFPDPDIMKKDDDPPAPAAIRDRTKEMREELLLRMAELAGRLPPNALDELVHRLGGAARVAEMTGRKYRVVENNGQFVYESRSESNTPLEILNLTEKQRFMDGEKDVAIISEAASSGISLQSDKRVKNQKQRVHITLELPWSADRAVQQFGRTHRSNQANAPEYVFLISDLVGEWRFASTVAKRLESLGALTHGDRRATDTLDLSQFNIENKFGRSALKHVQRVVCGKDAPLVAPPADYPGNFLRDAAAALANVGVNLKETVNIQRFLNRLLGVPVRLQNAIFRYFSDIFVYTVNQAKRSGRFDLGILDLGRTGECVQCVRTVRFLRAHATGCAPVSLHVVRSERGMTWEAALQKHAECRAPGEGFYLTRARCNRQRNAVLCCASGPGTGRNLGHTLYTLYKPNVGQVARAVLLGEVARAHEPAAAPAAGLAWRAQHAAALSVCSHRYWRGACAAPHCEVGLRVRTYHVLSGSVLAVWARVEAVLVQCSILNKTQVVRVRTDQGHKIIGTLFPKSCVEALIEDLKTDSLEYSDQSF